MHERYRWRVTVANAAVEDVIAFSGACVPTLDLELRSI
jgi:hypothetical protein